MPAPSTPSPLSGIPHVDFYADLLQRAGDAKIPLLHGPLSPEGPEAVRILLTAASEIGLRNEEILLTLIHDEARLQVLPVRKRRS